MRAAQNIINNKNRALNLNLSHYRSNVLLFQFLCQNTPLFLVLKILYIVLQVSSNMEFMGQCSVSLHHNQMCLLITFIQISNVRFCYHSSSVQFGSRTS